MTLASTILGLVLFAAAAYRHPDPESARLFTDAGWISINLGAGPPAFASITAYALAWARPRRNRSGLAVPALLRSKCRSGGSCDEFAGQAGLAETGYRADTKPAPRPD